MQSLLYGVVVQSYWSPQNPSLDPQETISTYVFELFKYPHFVEDSFPDMEIKKFGDAP